MFLLGWVTHICFSKLNIIGSDNGLSPDRRQAIIWTDDGILLIGILRTNFCGIWIKIHTFSFKKIHLKMSSGKCWPFYLGLNVLTHWNGGLIQWWTHWGWGMHICISTISHLWFRWWLVACSAPSHYENQCWLINQLDLKEQISVKS